MRQSIREAIPIPAGVTCTVAGNSVSCNKGAVTLSRVIDDPEVAVAVVGSELIVECKKGNRHHNSVIKSLHAHIVNMFQGLENKFVYLLEECHVHFPMTLKVEGNRFIINNFLGERVPRVAPIVPGVSVEIKGAQITIASSDKEAAGQTAANIEKATRIKKRDRRVFQDGIYIVQKPGRKIQ